MKFAKAMNTGVSPPRKRRTRSGKERVSQVTTAGDRSNYPAAEISSSPVIGFMLKPSLRTFYAAFPHFNSTTTISPRGGNTPQNKKKK